METGSSEIWVQCVFPSLARAGAVLVTVSHTVLDSKLFRGFSRFNHPGITVKNLFGFSGPFAAWKPLQNLILWAFAEFSPHYHVIVCSP